MENFYFTFGQIHTDIDGSLLKDYWVRVIASDYSTARSIFIDKFTKPYLSRPMAWSFQYKESEFNPEFFTGGELIVISQQDIDDDELESIINH